MSSALTSSERGQRSGSNGGIEIQANARLTAAAGLLMDLDIVFLKLTSKINLFLLA